MKLTTDRVLVTLAALVVYRFGFTVPIPGLSPEYLTAQRDQGFLFGLMSALSGGAFGLSTVFALALLPYFTASILVWSLVKAVPEIRELQATDRSAGMHIDRWKRYVVVPISIALALSAFVGVFLRDPRSIESTMRGHELLLGSIVVLSLLAGALIVQWLAELIDEHGIGHGAWLIVAGGFLARIPHTLYQLPAEEFFPKLLATFALWLGTGVLTIYVISRARRSH